MILVAHASKRGSTEEVATFVAERLRGHGLVADLRPAAQVDDLAAYDAVVVGGSLYFGRWHGDAIGLLKRHRLDRPLAVFALGPKTAEEHDLADARAQLDRALKDVEPATVAVFGGVIDPEKLRFPFNRLSASDARDWDAIATWAEKVESLLAGSEAAA